MAYEKNLVSVVIPTYNRRKTLEASIRSVTDQTYGNIEVLIVDDGSTDGTQDLVQRLQSEDSRIKYMKNTMEKGVAGARNTGIRESRGEFVAFNDSDDCFRKDKIHKQLFQLKNADFCYGRFKKIIRGNTYIMPIVQASEYSGFIYESLLKENLVGCPTLVARHEFMDDIGGFDPEFPALEDYDFALRLAKHGKAAFVEDIILNSYDTLDSISAGNGDFIVASIMMLQKYLADIIRTGLLEYKIQRILSISMALGVQDKVTEIIKHILEQYEMKASGNI